MTTPPSINFPPPPPPDQRGGVGSSAAVGYSPEYAKGATLGYSAGSPLPSARDGGLIVRIICWVVILGMAAIEITANVIHPPGAAAAKAAEKAATPTTVSATHENRAAAADDEIEASPTIAIGGRYAVAVHAWGHDAAKSAMPTMLDQLDQQAKTPLERIDVAIVAGEVSAGGNDRLTKIAAEKNLSPTDRKTVQLIQTIDRAGPSVLTKKQQDWLIQNLGWFGRLALVHGLPASNPARRSLIDGIHHLLLTTVAFTVILVVLLLAGVALAILAIVLYATGRIHLRYRVPPPGSAYLEIFALYMFSFLVVSLIVHWISDKPSLGWTAVATIILVPIALFWPVLRGETFAAVRAHLGWNRGAGILTEMGVGIATYVTFLPAMAIAFTITRLLGALAEHMHWIGSSPTHPIVQYLTGSPGTLFLVYLIASVCAPLLEETMFRGALFHHLRGRHGWWVSALFVSVLFASIHPQGWTLIPTLATLAMCFSAMREWRGSLIPSMTAHALNNAAVLTLAILMLR